MPICVATFYLLFQLLLPLLFSSHEYSRYSLFKDYNDQVSGVSTYRLSCPFSHQLAQ